MAHQEPPKSQAEPAKPSAASKTPMEYAEQLLIAIENATPAERYRWDMDLVRCIDMHPNDFLLGLRRLVRGQ